MNHKKPLAWKLFSTKDYPFHLRQSIFLEKLPFGASPFGSFAPRLAAPLSSNFGGLLPRMVTESCPEKVKIVDFQLNTRMHIQHLTVYGSIHLMFFIHKYTKNQ